MFLWQVGCHGAAVGEACRGGAHSGVLLHPRISLGLRSGHPGLNPRHASEQLQPVGVSLPAARFILNVLPFALYLAHFPWRVVSLVVSTLFDLYA